MSIITVYQCDGCGERQEVPFDNSAATGRLDEAMPRGWFLLWEKREVYSHAPEHLCSTCVCKIKEKS